MTEVHSTGVSADSKPAKPSPDFPLFPHATKRWAKKINRRMVYFGPWDDAQAALRAYKGYLRGRPVPKTVRAIEPGGERPLKPYPTFPLFAHATRRWAKKIRGKMHYFGPWSDPDGALKKYQQQKDDLHAGRTPEPTGVEVSAGVTVKDLCNRFLNAKQGRVDSGELTLRSWRDYKAACDLLVSHFGRTRLVAHLRPDDFTAFRSKLAAKWGPVTLSNVIQRLRVVFKFAWDNDLIDRPVRCGQEFKRPSKKVLRVHRAKGGPKLFSNDQILRMVKGAGPAVRAMILLGINGGFGNADCGTLPLSAVDLDAAVIDFPRPKTGVARRVPLWPETVKALRDAARVRPAPKDQVNAGLVFVTKYGLPWAKETSDPTLAKEFTKLLRRINLPRREGCGFYTLRHTFRTIADAVKDQPAVNHIMGHSPADMASVYRETISDDRLRAVVEHVRAWLFAKPAKKAGRGEKKPAA